MVEEVEKHSTEMIRYDWMQDLLEWFDFYLRGEGEQLLYIIDPIKVIGVLKTAIHQSLLRFSSI